MRRAAALSLSFFFLGVASAAPYPNDPEGFREHPWQTPKSRFQGLRRHESYGAYVVYARAKDDLTFEGMKVSRILYGFTSGRFENATVRFEGGVPIETLRSKLTALYGPGERVGKSDLLWRGGRTNIKLNAYGAGVEVIFSDGRAWDERTKKIDAFNERWQAYWKELLGSDEPPAAAAKLKAWLGREGKDLLDSYSVSAKGDKISLSFKGGGTYLFSPSANNARQALFADKIYSAAELVDILGKDPERLRGKDVRARLTAVDSVRGMGCNDYALLTDARYAALYARQYDRGLSEADKAALKNIPMLLSGPTLDMPEGVRLPGGAGRIVRGHFFDPAMKSCSDGAKRLVITASGGEDGRRR